MKKVLCLVWVFVLFSCQKSLKEILRDTEGATFIIYTYDEFGAPSGFGSGFFIDEKGTGITNYHVLDKSVKAIIKLNEDWQFEIDKVIASDRDWDIVKFTIKNPENYKLKYLKISDKKMEKGDVVYNISNPLGFEESVSNGIISSLRDDIKYGEIVQTTAPISQGSSGSALLNEKGEVFAVATLTTTQGQNINFGVTINHLKLAQLQSNIFQQRNAKFNQKDNFIILNLTSDSSPDITLNAIEFKREATIAYFSYTNLNMALGSEMAIWCELGKKDKGFVIQDLDRKRKYYILSSTIGTDKESGAKVSLASNHKFKVFFPPVRNKLHHINILCNARSKGWQFRSIDLDKYRNNIHFDSDNYRKEYAYSAFKERNYSEAISIFNTILEKNPDDIQALNALGIISYIIDNNSDSEFYFSKAIESNPTNATSYLNRAQVRKYQRNYEQALQDVRQAISINSQPTHYALRAQLYMGMELWRNAERDWTRVIATDDFRYDPYAYYRRALCWIGLNNWSRTCYDIQTAYSLTAEISLREELLELWNTCDCGY